nr:pentatricopeptide repeat-containing protein At3g02330 [Ipomoea batatas]
MASHLYITKLLFSPPKLSLSYFALRTTVQLRAATTVAAAQTSPFYNQTFCHIFRECSRRKALYAGKQAHALMVTSGFEPTVYVTNCLILMYTRCSDFNYADKVFDRMPNRDVATWNAMISRYSAVGDLGNAQMMFDCMPERDVISWNSMMSGYLQNGDCQKSVEVFGEMGREGIAFDSATFVIILKTCLALENYGLGLQVHGLGIKLGLVMDVMTGTAILDMYAKCKRLDDSVYFFSEMPEKNTVTWSALIAGYVQNNQLVDGLELFKKMQNEGVGVSQSAYASVFRSCAGLSNLRFGSQLHGHALKTNFGSDIIVGTSTLDMYAKCNKLVDARKVFNLLPIRNLQSYNALIVGYARGNESFEALRLFRLLVNSGLGFDEVSLSGVFSACAGVKGHLQGIQVHALAIKTPFHSNVSVANAILDMYGKCGGPFEAHCVFDEMEVRDAVSWNAIIAAYEQNGFTEETLLLFVWMIRSGMEPDEFTYGSVMKVCAAQQALHYGMEIHSRIIKSGMGFDSFVGSSVVDMYCKCAKLEDVEILHDRLQEQGTVSWNSMISGFSLHEKSEEAQTVFSKMLSEGIQPDNFTYATVLDICANMATVGLGKQIHAQIIKQELLLDAYIVSTLVDMYSKCGNLQDSRLMFEKAPNRDNVTWNAIICGYAQHGLAEEALQIFGHMELEGIAPNHSTFLSVLRACVHMGLVEKGFHYFNLMLEKYGLEPQIEHFSCMVEILGRAGQVTDALNLIQEMPFEPDDVIWRTLLSTCKMHGNVEVAEVAANSLLQLDPEDSSTYVLLSSVYATAGMWKRVAELRKVMRFGSLKKEPGCSWIEVNSEVHMFVVGDKAHPRCTEIYMNLQLLISEMKLAGYDELDGEFAPTYMGKEDSPQELFLD